ncbi:hypothetical protein E4U55_007109 [Claviceps digitariae]|nr:hypothetical protein E4U55_007109 [Claviceps digitariae]
MGFHLFRSSGKDKSTSDKENECVSGYDEYGMTNDKQWARKYLLDPLTAPEPCQETWPAQKKAHISPPARSDSTDGVKVQQRDLRDTLDKVNRRLWQFKQRCRRHSSAKSPSRSRSRSQSRNRSRSQSGSSGSSGNNLHHQHNNNNNNDNTENTENTSAGNNISADSSSVTSKPIQPNNYRSRYPRDARFAAIAAAAAASSAGPPNRGSIYRRSLASSSSSKPSGRIWDFDPTNPYYGASSSSSSSSHRGPRRHSRHSLSSSHHHGRHFSSSSSVSSVSSSSGSPSRRRSSAHTSASSSPSSLYGGARASIDLGPYPAHLTHPKPQLVTRQRSIPEGLAAPVSWENHKCNQLEKARLLSASPGASK